MKNPIDILQEQFLQTFAKPTNSDDDNRFLLEWYVEQYERLCKEQEQYAKNNQPLCKK